MSLSDNDHHRKEGWISYRRKKFKKGFIDCFTGDSSDDPNAIAPYHFKLNSFSQWYRLNGEGVWYNESQFHHGFKNVFLNDRLYFEADEVWQNYFIGEP